MSNRAYSVSVSFPSGVNLVDIKYDVEQQEAGNGGSLSTTLSHINIVNDTLTMYFNAVLTAGDETILDNVVTNYVFTPLPNETRRAVEVFQNAAVSTVYSNVACITYPGELYTTKIKAFIVITTVTANITSYDIRIYDTTNSLTIAEETKTDKPMTIHRLSTLSNLPKKEVHIGVQVRQTGGTIDDSVTINGIEIVTSP